MERKKHGQYAVLGLGSFGMSVVKTLAEYGVSILACDRDSTRIHEATEFATHVIQLDAMDETTLLNLGLGNFDAVIIAMAEDFEASVMATMIAKEQGAKFIMVKAHGNRQKGILESIGANEVILPEHEMGRRVARHLVDPNVLDVFDESEHFCVSEMRPHKEWIDTSVKQADIRRKHNVTILAIRRNKKLIIPVSPDEILRKEDLLVVLRER